MMARRRTQDRKAQDDDANSDVIDDVRRTQDARRTEVERMSDGSQTDVGRKSDGSRTEVR